MPRVHNLEISLLLHLPPPTASTSLPASYKLFPHKPPLFSDDFQHLEQFFFFIPTPNLKAPIKNIWSFLPCDWFLQTWITYFRNASEMLVAPHISQWLGLPWSALVCHSGCCWLGCIPLHPHCIHLHPLQPPAWWMVCLGLPWPAMVCHGLPWSALV